MSIFVSCDKLFQRVVSKCLIVLQKDLEKSNEQMQKINFALSTILSEAIKRETVVQEVGHALGLAHCQEEKNGVSVMRRLGFNGKAKPLSDDIAGIRELY